ncbi:hypothetical protein [Luteimonas salinilitoris]|uniref:Uncharacterized protein n=1 Tax=Luteimonas salinilitoris TaxID=3237697 RepID=A0ABV4HRX1_9GAMM
MNQTAESHDLSISVASEPRYVLGYPILVAITLRNDSADTDYLNIADLGLVNPIDSLAVNIVPSNGGPARRLGPSFTFRDQDLFRTTLMSKQSRRMLVDLSQFGQSLDKGKYQVRFSVYISAGAFASSPPVEMEFIEPSSKEGIEAARLRRLGLRANAEDYGSWQPFLTNNWESISASEEIGEPTRRQLSLHLFLHRAAYGQESIANLSMDGLGKLQGSVLSPEAACLEYELLAARLPKPELASRRAEVLQKWPELETRLDKIDAGEGLLTTLRRGYGAEKRTAPPPDKRPYRNTTP